MINRPADIVRELRYVALNRTIEESGYKTLIDLPCGYTPKVFEFVEKGMDYVGCDLPAVINDFAPIIDSMAGEEEKKHIGFASKKKIRHLGIARVFFHTGIRQFFIFHRLVKHCET